MILHRQLNAIALDLVMLGILCSQNGLYLHVDIDTAERKKLC